MPALLMNDIPSVLLFDFLSRDSAKGLLTSSELFLILASLAVVIGIIGEEKEEKWIPPRESAKRWHKMFILLVILGVAGEFFADGFIFSTSHRLQTLEEADIAKADETARTATETAKTATERAADAETKAATLLKENIELERALAPRNVDQFGLAQIIAPLPRVPIYIAPIDLEESKQFANDLYFAMHVRVDDTDPWESVLFAPEQWTRQGVSILYVDPFTLEYNNLPTSDKAKTVAIAICKYLREEKLDVEADGLGIVRYTYQWMKNVAPDAIIIRIGAKPNNFWTDKYLREHGQQEIDNTHFCTPDEFFEWAHKKQSEEMRGSQDKK
jgi:hypothetical protein